MKVFYINNQEIMLQCSGSIASIIILLAMVCQSWQSWTEIAGHCSW